MVGGWWVMTLDIFHQGGGCEALVRQEGNELNDLKVHHYFCENKPTHIAVFESGKEKKCCDEHAAMWLDSSLVVDLVPL